MNEVDRIAAVRRNRADKPLEDQRIKQVTVETFGAVYGAPGKYSLLIKLLWTHAWPKKHRKCGAIMANAYTINHSVAAAFGQNAFDTGVSKKNQIKGMQAAYFSSDVWSHHRPRCVGKGSYGGTIKKRVAIQRSDLYDHPVWCEREDLNLHGRKAH